MSTTICCTMTVCSVISSLVSPKKICCDSFFKTFPVHIFQSSHYTVSENAPFYFLNKSVKNQLSLLILGIPHSEET